MDPSFSKIYIYGNWIGKYFIKNYSVASNVHSNFAAAISPLVTAQGLLDDDDPSLSVNSPICEKIFTCILNLQPERIDIATRVPAEYSIAQTPNESNTDGWYNVPVQIGDAICFKLTIRAHANQITTTSSVVIPNRIYLITGFIT